MYASGGPSEVLVAIHRLQPKMRDQKHSEPKAIDYIVSLSGSGGAFKLYLSTALCSLMES